MARVTWFREGTARRCFVGPYAALVLEICPQMRSRMMVFRRAYEPEVTSLLTRVIRPGMVVYNVGAHVGIHALYVAKRLQRRGTVYAFEPWPDNYRVLARNVARNQARVAEIIPIQKAVGCDCGIVMLSEGAGDGQHRVRQAEERAAHRVDCTTLDTMWAKTQECPAVIIVDVEGDELNVLRGASRLIGSCHPQLILEHHGAERSADLREWLWERDYNVQSLGQRHLYAQAVE